MRYVVAVSGGVDSVVLLDMLVSGKLDTDNAEFVVAHFDHGIRDDSAEDAKFVQQLAEKYDLVYETKREELGATASEELARKQRYAFLRSIAKKHQAKIVTAHHADDVIETIAINLTRGTGWRGLAVLDSSDIWRPLLSMKKTYIIEYARKHGLEWREDPTNSDTKYLRNDLRQKLSAIDGQTQELLRLYRNRQVFLRREVDNEVKTFIGPSPYSRYLLIMLPPAEASEVLRAILISETGIGPTRPQLERTLLAIKTFHGGKRYEVGNGTSLVFTKTHYVVEQ